MQHGAGNPRQFGCFDLAIRFVNGAPDCGAEAPDRAAQPRLEKQPLDPLRIALEQGGYGSEPADPYERTLIWPWIGAATAGETIVAARNRHCEGAAPGAA